MGVLYDLQGCTSSSKSKWSHCSIDEELVQAIGNEASFPFMVRPETIHPCESNRKNDLR